MNATLNWIIRNTARLMGRIRHIGSYICACGLLALLAGCGLFSLDNTLKKTIRESDKELITPALACYKAHGTKPDPANPGQVIPFDHFDHERIDTEHKYLRRAVDAEESEGPK